MAVRSRLLFLGAQNSSSADQDLFTCSSGEIILVKSVVYRAKASTPVDIDWYVRNPDGVRQIVRRDVAPAAQTSYTWEPWIVLEEGYSFGTKHGGSASAAELVVSGAVLVLP